MRASAQATSGCASARAASSAPEISLRRDASGISTPCRAMKARSALRRRAMRQRAQRADGEASAIGQTARDRCAALSLSSAAASAMCAALRASALSTPGQCSRISGMRRWRRKLREKRVSAFEGSSIQRSRALRASASISLRDTSSNGRAMKPGTERRESPASRRGRRRRRRETTAAAAFPPDRRDAAR